MSLHNCTRRNDVAAAAAALALGGDGNQSRQLVFSTTRIVFILHLRVVERRPQSCDPKHNASSAQNGRNVSFHRDSSAGFSVRPGKKPSRITILSECRLNTQRSIQRFSCFRTKLATRKIVFGKQKENCNYVFYRSSVLLKVRSSKVRCYRNTRVVQYP